jgi:chemotaxis protein methyltransferase CheR
MNAAPRVEPDDDLNHDFSEGEFPFKPADFDNLANILRNETGIVLDRGKMPLVYSRLAKRVRATGLNSFKQYHAHISTHAGLGEHRLMIEALTTNVTGFFREALHFEHLAAQVLPALITEARQGGRVRLWSAGCSSGEEPYSIALTILSLFPDAARYDLKILATDIDTQVLAAGRAGRYSDAAAARIDPTLRARWMVREEAGGDLDGWRAGPEMQTLVSFRTANLLGDWPMKGPFQVIFCRNVVIYFDETLRDEILNKMTRLLCAGGHLYVGHSERLKTGDDALRFVGPSTYRRSDGAALAIRAPKPTAEGPS